MSSNDDNLDRKIVGWAFCTWQSFRLDWRIFLFGENWEEEKRVKLSLCVCVCVWINNIFGIIIMEWKYGIE